jgi:hypothetical protein
MSAAGFLKRADGRLSPFIPAIPRARLWRQSQLTLDTLIYSGTINGAEKIIAMGKKIKNIHIIIYPAAGKGKSILLVINASMKEAGSGGPASEDNFL